MSENRIPYNSDKMDDKILKERKHERYRGENVSYELLREIDEIYNESTYCECVYCGNAVETTFNGYVVCNSCGYKEKMM